jgi:hypothetical protein
MSPSVNNSGSDKRHYEGDQDGGATTSALASITLKGFEQLGMLVGCRVRYRLALACQSAANVGRLAARPNRNPHRHHRAFDAIPGDAVAGSNDEAVCNANDVSV